MMRCAIARSRIARLNCEHDLAGRPWLSGHLDRCPNCAEVWRAHLRLLSELSAASPLPDFNDLAPRVLARLDARPGVHTRYWEWAAAAAMVLAALVVGYFIGMQSAELVASRGAEATYQDVLFVTPSDSAETAYDSLVADPIERRVP
ncbi:MAG: hypothetical protein AB1714_04395 [Acidobacteriota bacterium]